MAHLVDRSLSTVPRLPSAMPQQLEIRMGAGMGEGVTQQLVGDVASGNQTLQWKITQ